MRVPLRVVAHVERDMLGVLRSMFGTRLTIGDDTADGRVAVEVRGQMVESLGGELAGLAPWIEVVEPPEVRAHLARIGVELVDRYAS
jgi:hypothetical protein